MLDVDGGIDPVLLSLFFSRGLPNERRQGPLMCFFGVVFPSFHASTAELVQQQQSR
jgi:hypothetical protein